MSSTGAPDVDREIARRIALVLRDAGHEVVFAGGAVRDRLLGRPGHDVDIATSALPEQVMVLFPRTVPVGEAFGVVKVVQDGQAYDVATFRQDVGIGDGRHPAAVEAATLEEDVRRRDFTVNGLVEDPFSGEVIDHVGGLADLEARRLRAIGEPALRFREDALRLLRGVRFASVLELDIEPTTLAAMQAEAARLELISPERVRHELERMLPPRTRRRAVELMQGTGLLTWVLPEVAALQTDEDAGGDAWRRTLRTLDALGDGEISFESGLAALLLAAPLGEDAEVAGLCERLRLSRVSCRRVVALVDDQRERWGDVAEMRASTLRRFMDQEHFDGSLQLYCAACTAAQRSPSALPVIDAMRRRVGDGPLVPAPLLSGNELVELGVPPGPRLGELLARIADLQLEGELVDPDAARAWVVLRRNAEPD